MPIATILITTKDRKDELKDALESAIMQEGDIEVLVIDDGSTDGTYEYVKERYPSVRIVRYKKNLGLIEQRNNGIRLASAPYVITIDDDAVLTAPDTALKVVEEFESNPNAGALAMPYIDVLYDDQLVLQSAPDGRNYAMCSYRGTAHADRRDLFLELGGYRGFLYRQGEEGDYCTRILNQGYYVKVADTGVIKHMESPRRVKSMNMFYEMRNSVLYAWHNVPALFLLLHIAGTMLANFRKHVKLGWGCSLASLRGALAAFACIFSGQFSERAPVRMKPYFAFRYMKSRGVVLLDEVNEKYPVLS